MIKIEFLINNFYNQMNHTELISKKVITHKKTLILLTIRENKKDFCNKQMNKDMKNVNIF